MFSRKIRKLMHGMSWYGLKIAEDFNYTTSEERNITKNNELRSLKTINFTVLCRVLCFMTSIVELRRKHNKLRGLNYRCKALLGKQEKLPAALFINCRANLAKTSIQ